MENKKDSRGVKKGIKRGAYKKKILNDNLESELQKDIFKKRSSDAVKELKDSEVIKEPEIKEPENIKEPEPEIKEPEIKEKNEGEIEKEISKEKNKQFEKSGEQVYNDWRDEYKNVSDEKKPEPEPDELEDEPKEKRKYNKKSKEAVNSAEALRDANAQFVNGSMLLTFCDLIFPGIILFFFQKIKKTPGALKVKHTDLVLNDDQAQSIEQVADYAAKIVFEYINPMVLFVLNLGAMYYMNFKNALDEKTK